MKKKNKLIAQAKKTGTLQQVAALPYRRREDGNIDYLVITSRRTRRLIVPKGWPMKGKADCIAAAIEARQEAGVHGRIGEQPIGSFSYVKQLAEMDVPVMTHVFPLEVKKVKSRWKEANCRKRRWVSAAEAATLLSDRELADLVREVSTTLHGK
jgi:hypothetical protein